MNHFSKKPDAHCRLARGSGASFRALNNRRYMAKPEFTDRQMWLDFGDAVGPALEALVDVVMESRKRLTQWLKRFVRPQVMIEDQQTQLVFGWSLLN